jgi:hypothetical protein
MYGRSPAWYDGQNEYFSNTIYKDVIKRKSISFYIEILLDIKIPNMELCTRTMTAMEVEVIGLMVLSISSVTFVLQNRPIRM